MRCLRILFYINALGLFSNSCNKPHGAIYNNVIVDGETKIVKKFYDNTGSLIIEEILNKDSINDGYYKKWNIGKLQSSGTYSDGKKEGEWVYMDLAGDTIKIENWFSGRRFGNQYEFYSAINAKAKPPIYKFSFLNLNEEELSNIQFDINENVVKHIGLPLYCAYNKNDLQRNGTFELLCFWGCPPGLKFELTVEELNIKGELIQKKEITSNDKNYEVLDFANKFVFSKKYLISGSFKWKIILVLINKDNNEIIRDYSVVDLYVK